jgi:putative acyl-CoA dehydrogenase
MATLHDSLLETHSVENQPPPLLDYNAFDALRGAIEREGGAWGVDRARATSAP